MVTRTATCEVLRWDGFKQMKREEREKLKELKESIESSAQRIEIDTTKLRHPAEVAADMLFRIPAASNGYRTAAIEEKEEMVPEFRIVKKRKSGKFRYILQRRKKFLWFWVWSHICEKSSKEFVRNKAKKIIEAEKAEKNIDKGSIILSAWDSAGELVYGEKFLERTYGMVCSVLLLDSKNIDDRLYVQKSRKFMPDSILRTVYVYTDKRRKFELQKRVGFWKKWKTIYKANYEDIIKEEIKKELELIKFEWEAGHLPRKQVVEFLGSDGRLI